MTTKLSKLKATKEELLKSSLHAREEERICVICTVEHKSVLLMPCRHLCLCKICSKREEVTHCPLCRGEIEDRIDVFS